MKAILSDQEFITLWGRLGGAAAMSRETGISHRQILARRRRIEANHNIVLTASQQVEMKEQVFLTAEVTDGVIPVASDIHCWHNVNTAGQRAFIKFCKDLNPSIVVLNGDVFDGAKLSRFPQVEFTKLPSVIEELKACKEYLTKIQQAAPNARLIWVMGNHDQRFIKSLIAAAAEFEGVSGFDIRDHFPLWEFCYRFTINDRQDGMTDFVHNWSGGVNAALANTMKAGCNYITGHTHRLLDRPWNDRTGRRYGIETGTLIEIDGKQSFYVAGRPVDWGQGFPVLTFRNGLLMRPEYVDVLNKTDCCFRGEIFKV